MKQVILQGPKIKSNDFNQPLKQNTILKHVLAHGISLLILISTKDTLLRPCLSHGPDYHIS